MKTAIKIPSVGESVTQADIESWERRDGDFVKKGEILAILETDKASLELSAEADGLLSITKQQGATVSAGDVIGHIDTAAAPPADRPQKTAEGEKAAAQESPSSPQAAAQAAGRQAGPDSADAAGPASKKIGPDQSLSPSVRRIFGETGLSPPYDDAPGTGKGGRITKEDALKAVREGRLQEEGGEAAEKRAAAAEASQKTAPASLKEGQRREPMTRLRKKTAERLVLSQQSAAALSTFNEADMSRVIQLRKDWQDSFTKKHGVKLGFMGFFVKAVAAALREYPRIGAFIDGEDIVYNDFCHIGVAISSDRGLVVPVIFHAEKLSLAEIEKQIIVYRDKALSRKLSPDDLFGGTFTISNGGVFGSLLSTPILNPPQSGILGMHKIEQRPVALNGKVEIRPMMYLALTYDHRIVDGRESVGFLVRVKEGLEEPSRLLLDI